MAAAQAQVPARKKMSGVQAKRIMMAVWFTLPAFVAFIFLKYYPMMQAIYMSFFDYKVTAPPGVFVGIQNYLHAFTDPLNGKVWSNNIILFLWSLVLGFWVPLVQAILLDEIRRLKTFYRVMYLLPSVIPSVATAVIWKWIYNPDWGLLNTVFEKLGLPAQQWLNSPDQVKFSLMLPALLGGGLGIFIYLSALQGVPTERYEAADIDGATILDKVRYITLPGIAPIIGLQFILALTGAFQIFDQIYIMTLGGPADASRVIALNIYYYAFERIQMGYAASLSVLLFIVTFILVAIQLRFSRGEAQ